MKPLQHLSFAALRALVIFSGALCTPALAQQSIDEPRLDPIFGRPTPAEDRSRNPDPDEIANDDAFDNKDKRWSPLRGFVGVLTFMTPETTNLSLGVGPVYKPDYFGSNDYELEPDPQAYVKFRNFVFLDDDGADFALFGFSRFSFGPSFRIVGDRAEDENPALAGLGDVGVTFEAGGFAAANFFDRMSLRFKVRRGIKSGHRGLIVDASSTILLARWGRFSTSVTGQTTWIGSNYADAYFSVTPEQSARSGLPVYSAKRGLRDLGGSLNAYVNIRDKWSLNPYISYRYILNNIADTPIIEQQGNRNQFTAGFHLIREFQFDMK